MRHQIDKNSLTIFLKRAPLFVRVMYYVFTAICFLFPLVSVTLYAIYSGKLHFGFIFLFALFGVIGFFLLRASLWNTYGKETIQRNGNIIEYTADYGWFKDKARSLNVQQTTEVKELPHYNDGKFKLAVSNGDASSSIETAVPLEEDEAIQLVQKLEQLTSLQSKQG